MKAEHQVIIKESDWVNSKYRTKEWEQTVEIVRWEHDYIERIYTIDFNQKPN